MRIALPNLKKRWVTIGSFVCRLPRWRSTKCTHLTINVSNFRVKAMFNQNPPFLHTNLSGNAMLQGTMQNLLNWVWVLRWTSPKPKRERSVLNLPQWVQGGICPIGQCVPRSSHQLTRMEQLASQLHHSSLPIPPPALWKQILRSSIAIWKRFVTTYMFSVDIYDAFDLSTLLTLGVLSIGW